MRNLLVRMCIPKPHHAICRVPNIQHGVVHTIVAADHIAHLGTIAGAVCGEQIWKQPAAVLRSCMVCRAPPEHSDLRHTNGDFLFHLLISPFLILTVLIYLVNAISGSAQRQNIQRD